MLIEALQHSNKQPQKWGIQGPLKERGNKYEF